MADDPRTGPAGRPRRRGSLVSAGAALGTHWLAWANTLTALFVALPFVAPALLALGQPEAASLLYAAYRGVCHQWAFRSYFLFGSRPTYGMDELSQLVGPTQVYSFLGTPELGYKVAFCERDVAIYLAVLGGGLLYARLRHRVPALGPLGYLALIVPMALDGFTQLFGWRESSVELRTLTGTLFGLASVWLAYPRIDRVLGGRVADRASALSASPVGRRRRAVPGVGHP